MSSLERHFIAAIFSLSFFLPSFQIESAQAELEVIVPAYFYPVNNSPWDDLTAATSQVDITAIMNPASGSGVSQDLNYVSVVNSLQSAGGKVVGYVPTTYGARPLANVKADVDNYYTWYGVDGIFFDEMANSGPAEVIQYYQELYAYVKSKDAVAEVIGNPGTNTLEAYLNFPGGPTADQLVISENLGSQYPSFSPSSWVYDYERTNFAHLVHSESSSANMVDYLELAVTRNAGSVYITNDVLGNPWDTLPSYWQAELDAIEQINNAILAGDFNENGTVDGDDLALWTSGYGTSGGASKYQGDANGDGLVNGIDLLQWQADFGKTTVPLPLAAAENLQSVPEPASAAIAGLLASCWLTWNRRWNRREKWAI